MPDQITEPEIVLWLAERKGTIEQFDNFNEVLWSLRDLYHLKKRKGCCYTICNENGALIYRKGMHFQSRLGWAVLTRVIENEATRKT
jgi:hypothetical protein